MSNDNSIPGAISTMCHKILKQQLINFKELFFGWVSIWIMKHVKESLQVIARFVAGDRAKCT